MGIAIIVASLLVITRISPLVLTCKCRCCINGVNMTPSNTTLGHKIRELREAKGLTQDQLAACAGVRQSAVSWFETGEKTPRIATLQRLASCLGVSTSVLIESLEQETVAL
jgi:DNA-binding XRE family transcriptional regulator